MVDEAEPEFLEIAPNDPRWDEAIGRTKRMWYAFADSGEEMESTILILATALLLSKQADCYSPAGIEDGWIDQIARLAKEHLHHQRETRVKQ